MALRWTNILAEDLSTDDASAQLEGECAWTERYSIANTIMGGYYGSSYVPPMVYPYSWNLVAKHVSMKKKGEVAGTPNSRGCVLVVDFALPKAEETTSAATGIELFTASVQVSCEGVSIPKGNYTWSNGDALTDDDITIQKWIPAIEVSLKCGRMKKLSTDAISQLAGKLNSSTFSIPNDDSFGVGQVMFLTSAGDQKTSTTGVDYASRDLKFMIRRDGWNKLWKPSTETWDTVNPQIFTSADFSSLYED